MALKEFDFKKFLLEKGERVGLGVALAVALLLVAVSAIQALNSGSPKKREADLLAKSEQVNRKLSDPNNLPGPQDKPPPESKDELIAYQADTISPDKFRLNPLTPEREVVELGRRLPRVFTVDEAHGAVDHVLLRSYVFIPGDPPKIVALVEPEDKDKEKPSGPSASGKRNMTRLQGLYGGMRGMPGMGRPGMGRPGMGMPGAIKSEKEEKDYKQVFIPLDELSKRPDAKLAEQTLPARMVVVAGSFPYKKQLEEFRAKLGLKTVADVLCETAKATQEGADRKPEEVDVPAFRFLGVNVERREVDGTGKRLPGEAGEFQKLELDKDYRPYLFWTGKRFEPNDPKYAPITFKGLVMPRLLQFREGETGGTGMSGMGRNPRGGPGPIRPPAGRMREPAKETEKDPEARDQYTKVEDEVKNLKETLATLEKAKDATVAAPPSQFDTGGLDIFAGEADGGDRTEGPATMPRGMRRPSFNPRKPRERPGADEGPLEVPEYCLVRLVDVTVKPGHNYEYRFQVRMANPNYGRKDVASLDYATESELKSEFSKVTVVVRVPPELYYYAVDEAELSSKYTGPHMNPPVNKDKQAVLQAHRWLDRVRPTPDYELLVGEWSVADRFPVSRGEYVGRKEQVPVPYWRYTREGFVLAGKAPRTPRNATPTIPVRFGYNRAEDPPEAILVDFDSHRQSYERVVKRSEDKVETRRVSDPAAPEVLMLSPEGRLLALEGARDAADSERKERRQKVLERIKEVKEKKSEDGGKKGGTPFRE